MIVAKKSVKDKSAELSSNFGARLRELRIARGWSQRDLSERADVHSSHVSELEAGNSFARWDVVLRLALALGIDPLDFTKPPGKVKHNPEVPTAGRPVVEPDWSGVVEPDAEKKIRAAIRLRELRLAQGLSQEQTASKAGIKYKNRVGNLERGQASLDAICQVIEALGGNTKDLR